MVGRKIVTKADQLAKKNLIALTVIFQNGSGDSAVGDGNDGAVFGTKVRGAQADVLDNAALIADAAGIADDQRFVDQGGNTREQSFECFLRAGADRQTAASQAGQSC